MNKFDILIVGAGPAGLIAAIRLAKAGYTVAIFEKETFPHIKTCGDLVTLEGLSLLKSVGLEHWMTGFRRVDALRFSSPDQQIIDIPVTEPGSKAHNRILPREQLDQKLAKTALKTGVKLFEGQRVQQAAIDLINGVKIFTASETYSGEILLLADGSHAPLTRKLGLLTEKPDLIAARQYLTAPEVDPAGPLEFHFQGNIIPGYTWLFPEGNGTVNLGCGTYTHRVTQKEIDLLAVIEDFKRNDPGLAQRLKNAEALGPIKAHPLRTHLGGTLTHGDRFMVLGDAAGLVSPFTGEGITSGMLSGAVAARFVNKAFEKSNFSAQQFSGYTQTLKDRFGRDHHAAYVLRSTLREPRLLNHFFKVLHQDPDFAKLFALTYLDEKSPQLLLHLRNLLKLV